MPDEALKISDLLGEGTTDVTWLSPTVLRFRFDHERELVGAESWDNLSVIDLTGSLRAWQDGRPRHPLWIDKPAELLDMTLAHFARPMWVFTNGIGCASIAETTIALTVAHHRSLHSYLGLASKPATSMMLQPEQVEVSVNLHDAELSAYGHLANGVHAQTVKLARGDEVAAAVFHAGERPQPEGEQVFVACTPGGVVALRTIEAYRMLNTFRPDGFRVNSCATCRYFRFSAMMREAGGNSGYCIVSRLNPAVSSAAHIKTPARAPLRNYSVDDPPVIVSVFDLCRHHEFIEDRDRDPGYLLSREDLIRWFESRRARTGE